MGHRPLWTAVAALWFATLVAAGYLLAIGSVAVWCRRARRPAILQWVRHLTPPPLRLMLGIGLGIATATTSAGAMSAPRRAGPADPPPVLRLVGPSATPTPHRATAAEPLPRPAPPDCAASGTPSPLPKERAVLPVRGPATTSLAQEAPARSTPPATWTIRPGDHLWAVADATLTRAWGRTPDARTLGSYWWTLVQLNRPRLPDPANPDLVYPGDLVLLPPVPPPPPAR
ncbi:MAG: LysM peptidoglycan-binding domain-containing protein [Acidimicrobiales bacterium]